MNARRAVWRWAWRMLRIEWRSHLTMTVTITVAVALSVGGALFAHHGLPPADGLDEGLTLTLQGDDDEIRRFLERVQQIGEVGVIERGQAKIGGSAASIDVLALDTSNKMLRPLVDVLEGRPPSGPAEVALTHGASDQLVATIGDSVMLSGLSLTVSGFIENPTDLTSDFALVDHVTPPPLETSTFYRTSGVDMGDIEALGFAGNLGASENVGPQAMLPVLINAVVAMAMLLVGLLVSASFAVAAQRRTRQFGLLGAIGAEPRHLRSAAAFSGFVVGIIASVVGTGLGVAGAWLVLPRLEESVGHRIGFGAPLVFWLPAAVTAVVVATVASLWPVRTMARQPITEMLAARRPRRRPTRPVSAAGILLSIAGYFLIGWGVSNQSVLRLMVGLTLAVVGVVLMAPTAVMVIGRLAGRSSLPLRIAGRDISRFQGRSAAALGAIALALSIPVGIGVVTASQDARAVDAPRNLPIDSAIVWAPGVDRDDSLSAPVDLSPASTTASLERVRAFAPDIEITPIQVPVDLTMPVRVNDNGVATRSAHDALTPLECGRNINGNTWTWGDENGESCFRAHPLWIASPELAHLWGLAFDNAGSSGAVVLREGLSETEFFLMGADATVVGPPTDQAALIEVSIPNYASFPNVLVTPDALGEGFGVETIGWILTSADALSTSDVVGLRNAMQAGAELETMSQRSSTAGVRKVAAIVGLLVGLAVLGATVTLIRGESANDLRVLTSLGASARVTRTIAGCTAGLLAFGGAMLALPLGYVALVIAQAASEGHPFVFPWSTLLIVLVVFPTVATCATASFTRVQADGLARIPAH